MDDYKFNFGKYKGRTFEDVLENEPDYVDWILKIKNEGQDIKGFKYFIFYLEERIIELSEDFEDFFFNNNFKYKYNYNYELLPDICFIKNNVLYLKKKEEDGYYEFYLYDKLSNGTVIELEPFNIYLLIKQAFVKSFKTFNKLKNCFFCNTKKLCLSCKHSVKKDENYLYKLIDENQASGFLLRTEMEELKKIE
jgi:hypothetical protein